MSLGILDLDVFKSKTGLVMRRQDQQRLQDDHTLKFSVPQQTNEVE
jgi:hypothetical protein